MALFVGKILCERQADWPLGVIELDLSVKTDEGEVEIDAVVVPVDDDVSDGEAVGGGGVLRDF